MWKGEQADATGIFASEAEVMFKDEGGQIRRDLTVTFRGREGKASGTAKVSGDTVEMNGQYSSGFTGYLSCSLVRRGDTLEGTGIGAANRPFRVSWKKVK